MELRASSGHVIVIPEETVEHLKAHPDVWDVLKEAVGLLVLDGSFCAKDVDLGRVIGKSGCVPASKISVDEVTTFALRTNRTRPSRVVVADKVDTSKVSIIAAPKDESTYTLFTAWIGELAPKEPGDAASEAEREGSLAFWTSHALVWDAETCGEIFETTWEQVLEG